jgi:hypothetical protein
MRKNKKFRSSSALRSAAKVDRRGRTAGGGAQHLFDWSTQTAQGATSSHVIFFGSIVLMHIWGPLPRLAIGVQQQKKKRQRSDQLHFYRSADQHRPWNAHSDGGNTTTTASWRIRGKSVL